MGSAQGVAGEGGVRLRVLQGQSPTGQHAHRTGTGQALSGDGDGLQPGRRPELAVLTDHRRGEPVTDGVAEAEAVLVGDPLLVDLRVVAGETTHDLAAAVVDADRGAAGVVLGDARGRDQVEGPSPEPVVVRGQRAHRADLDDVAGEVGRERLVLGDADLLLRTTLDQRDPRVARDLGGEAGAALADDAPLTVEQHVGREVDRLREGPLGPLEAGLTLAVGHRLVLQRALAALVAHRAVQRVVDQQKLHDPVLGLHSRGVLRLHHHALGHRDRAGGLRLREAAAVARVGDVDQALPAGADGREQRVVAEARDLDPGLLGRPDHQRALGHGHVMSVDLDGHIGHCTASARWPVHPCNTSFVGLSGRSDRASSPTNSVLQLAQLIAAPPPMQSSRPR